MGTHNVKTEHFISALLYWHTSNSGKFGSGVKLLKSAKMNKQISLLLGEILDENHNGEISPIEIKNALSFFGPLHHFVPKVLSLLDSKSIPKWFVFR